MSKKKVKETGRPPKYKNAKDLEKRIDEYFTNGVHKKKVLVGKGAEKELVEIEIPTITGLALFLGFSSRQSFYDYEKTEIFSYTIKRARTFIERHYEELLQQGSPTGAIFALKNMGWRDKVETELSGGLDNKVEQVVSYQIPDNNRG